MVISSMQNDKIKYLRSLFKKKYRRQEGKIVLEGARLIEEALQAEANLEDIFISPEAALTEESYILAAAREAGINIHQVEDELLAKICETENPQGILATALMPGRPVSSLNVVSDGRYLALDRVQDPGNLGTIVRTAAGAGYTAIIIIKGTVDPFNTKAIRASMGGIFRIPLYSGTEEEAVKQLKGAGARIYVSDIREGAHNYFQVGFQQPFALVMGNEANGVSGYLLEEADTVVKIPQPGGIESLNVAIAAGILLYYSVFANNRP
ncbi:MAG: RNA methyltransferase [Halanaerobium sp.]|nr:RNA methyltransferase [Halanaerobium sp.]